MLHFGPEELQTAVSMACFEDNLDTGIEPSEQTFIVLRDDLIETSDMVIHKPSVVLVEKTSIVLEDKPFEESLVELVVEP